MKKIGLPKKKKVTITQIKRIPLTQGKYAIVDSSDYDWLSKYNWHLSSAGYAVRNSSRKIKHGPYLIVMSRVINKTPVGMDTDHINRNKLDNRKCNLRTVTTSQNMINRPKQKNNKSGNVGVIWRNKTSKWESYLHINYKYIFLGLFSNLKDAIKARKNGAIKYHKI